MRILHTADWHLGRSLEQYSRLEEQAAFLNELQHICDREAVDLLLICGDVFDTYNPPAAAESLFYDALERLAGQGSRSVAVIAGNHDNPERLAAAAPLAYRHGVILLGYPSSDAGLLRQRNCGWPDSVLDAGPGYLKIRPPGADCAAVLITLPYPSEARLAAIAEKQTDESRIQMNYSAKIGQLLGSIADARFCAETVNLIAAHLFMQGGWTSDSERTLQMGAAMLVDPAVLPAAAQYAALGHLHRPQDVAGSPIPARYAGSPLAYSFSEADYAKSVCLVDVHPGEPAAVRTLPLNSGKPLRRWLAREGLAQALAWAREGRDANCWIDLEINSEHPLTAAQLRELRTNNPGILYIRTLLAGSPSPGLPPDARRGKKIDELFAEYYRFRQGVPIPNDVLATFIDLQNQEAQVDG